MTALATRRLLDRYDDARAACDRALAAGPADTAATARAAPVLAAEARMLDARRWEGWLALFAPEAALWIPAHPADHPARDQALAFDDLRRMTERARHMDDPHAWATTAPAPMTTRILGPVEAWAEPDGLLATAPISVTHLRRGPRLTLIGRQVLCLTPDGRRITFKALLFPDLATTNPAIGWLM